MTLNEYQLLAARTINMNLTMKDALHHSLFGLASEAGELLDIYQKELQGHPVDIEHAKKEASDCLWMIAEWCTVNRIENQDVVRDFLESHEEFGEVCSRQLLPNVDGTDGFYFCKMKKSEA